MNNKFWLLIAGVLGVGVLLMGWFLGVAPKLDEINAAESQRANVEMQNAAFEQTLAQLQEESKDIDKLRDELKALQVELPPGDALSNFLGQLHELEVASGVALSSFSASDGVPFVPAAKTPATALSPLVSAQNFIVLTINLKVEGTREQVLDFVSALQSGDRLFLVNSLNVVRGTDAEENYTGSISGFVYVLVDPTAPPPTPTPEKTADPEAAPEPTP